jgi:hypothetical protein
MADSRPEIPSMTIGNKSVPVCISRQILGFVSCIVLWWHWRLFFKLTLVCRNSTQHVMKPGVCEYIPRYIADPRGLYYCNMDRYCWIVWRKLWVLEFVFKVSYIVSTAISLRPTIWERIFCLMYKHRLYCTGFNWRKTDWCIMNVPVCEATSVVKIILMVTSNSLPYSLTNVSTLLTYYQAEGILYQPIARIFTILYSISACLTSSACTVLCS